MLFASLRPSAAGVAPPSSASSAPDRRKSVSLRVSPDNSSETMKRNSTAP